MLHPKNIKESNLIYMTDSLEASLRAIEFAQKTYNIQNITIYLNTTHKTIEQNLLDMQSYVLNKNCPITINCLNWKNKKIFRPSFESLLDSYKQQKIIIMVDAQSLKMFHTHFSYKDLLKNLNIAIMVFSKPRNLIWTYSPLLLKWVESKLHQKGLYFGQLEEAIRNSREEETPERFEHTIRVIRAAWEIMLPLNDLKEGIKFRVLIACAYHDFAKNWNLEKLTSSFIKKHPNMKDYPNWALHGPVASNYLKIRRLIKNPSILKAIECHTLPPKKLGTIGKIVVIADKLEPFKKNNFSDQIFQNLWSHLKMGEYEYVYEYLRLNPKIKKV